MPNVKLIVGLGNPGKRYEMTRHNIGYLVVDELASRLNAPLKTNQTFEGEVSRTTDLILLKPLTFMNLSGMSVSKVCHYYKVETQNVLVICDDAAIPFGTLRMREKGSSGGHNGLSDIIRYLGPEVKRLRIGIGDPGSFDLADYVLAQFSSSELEEIPQIIGEAATICETWLTSGFQESAEKAATWKG